MIELERGDVVFVNVYPPQLLGGAHPSRFEANQAPSEPGICVAPGRSIG